MSFSKIISVILWIVCFTVLAALHRVNIQKVHSFICKSIFLPPLGFWKCMWCTALPHDINNPRQASNGVIPVCTCSLENTASWFPVGHSVRLQSISYNRWEKNSIEVVMVSSDLKCRRLACTLLLCFTMPSVFLWSHAGFQLGLGCAVPPHLPDLWGASAALGTASGQQERISLTCLAPLSCSQCFTHKDSLFDLDVSKPLLGRAYLVNEELHFLVKLVYLAGIRLYTRPRKYLE